MADLQLARLKKRKCHNKSAFAFKLTRLENGRPGFQSHFDLLLSFPEFLIHKWDHNCSFLIYFAKM